jgi:hypothetical protein
VVNINLGDAKTVLSAKQAIDQASQSGQWLMMVFCLKDSPAGGKQLGTTWCAQNFPDGALGPAIAQTLRKIETNNDSPILIGQAPLILAP